MKGNSRVKLVDPTSPNSESLIKLLQFLVANSIFQSNLQVKWANVTEGDVKVLNRNIYSTL